MAQRIRLYCLGKDNGENIMKSIKEGPFQMGTVSDVITGGTEGAVQQVQYVLESLKKLSAEEKERYKADIRGNNILLQGSELTKDDRESQLYDEFEHFRQIKGETIQGYYRRKLRFKMSVKIQSNNQGRHFRETMQEEMYKLVLDEEQSLFLAGEQVTNVDDDVDDSQENDLALNVDHIFEADECDAFDSDVDEGPHFTQVHANLTSEDPIYEEAGPSYELE
ncbi:hypothetical protein Tco_0659078 [Tanacetum coccineum]